MGTIIAEAASTTASTNTTIEGLFVLWTNFATTLKLMTMAITDQSPIQRASCIGSPPKVRKAKVVAAEENKIMYMPVAVAA